MNQIKLGGHIYQNCIEDANFLALCFEIILKIELMSALNGKLVISLSVPSISLATMCTADSTPLSLSFSYNSMTVLLTSNRL